ncbi:MAG: cytochrome c3 family protein [Desulfobacterales bacterium]
MRNNLISMALMLLVVVFSGAFIYIFYGWPQTGLGPEQPIPFSHNVHSGVKQIQCQYCHPYVGYSNHPGIPAVAKCLHCHNYIIANHPWIKVEHRYYNTQTSTPWVKVNYVAEHVLFNHQRHINGKIACQECHGQVQNLQRLPYKNWRMNECITCHFERGANVDCWLACHS